MTTTKNYQGMEPGSKSSSRVLRPPGGASNFSLGADEEKPPVRKDKMASSVFAEPEDPYANRRNNPPGGKPTGVLCGEPSAPLRRGGNQTAEHTADAPPTRTALLSRKPFQSRRRRSPQPTTPLQEPPPAAGIPPGASPASSWDESLPKPPHPPLRPALHHSSLNLSFFMSFFYNKEPRPVRLNRRNRVSCATDSYTSLKCIVLIPLFWEKKGFVPFVCLF
uniref:Jupiter microtubule associated homolog 1a n=1 Tax=Gasterosteus aculeatus aculeatus TaxID=481459 RepID=G3Q6X2_GASAC